ncbi:DUF1440 domain-containing protein [Ilumatobacter sp.]|uniref:DUF1440 domain-containing protein n=1 Tax=Ilumatobacter sp. TaxID=1967498 RepID=UPI003B52AB38
MSGESRWAGVVAVGALSGAAASWVKSMAEPQLQRLGERLLPPDPEAKDELGADIEDDETMPPAVLADRVARRTRGSELSDDERSTAMESIHYAFGTAAGVAYAVAVTHDRRAAVGFGAAAGAGLFLATHASSLPLIGIQGRPDQMPRAWWIWELGSHLVFGMTIEALRRVLTGSGAVLVAGVRS